MPFFSGWFLITIIVIASSRVSCTFQSYSMNALYSIIDWREKHVLIFCCLVDLPKPVSMCYSCRIINTTARYMFLNVNPFEKAPTKFCTRKWPIELKFTLNRPQSSASSNACFISLHTTLRVDVRSTDFQNGRVTALIIRNMKIIFPRPEICGKKLRYSAL